MTATSEVTSYTEMIEGIKARLADLGIRYEDFDTLASFPDGLSGKVFGPSQVKRLGPEKLFDALRAAALRIRIEPDVEQLAKLQKQIAEKCQVRQANQARNGNHASPVGTALLSRVFKHLSRLGNEARKRKMTKVERSESAKHAANTRWKRKRKMQARRARQARAAHKARKMAAVQTEGMRNGKS